MLRFRAGLKTQYKQLNTLQKKKNDVVVKGCGAKTLWVNYETDVRKGYNGPFNVFTQFASKKAAQNCNEGDYQNIIPLRRDVSDIKL